MERTGGKKKKSKIQNSLGKQTGKETQKTNRDFPATLRLVAYLIL